MTLLSLRLAVVHDPREEGPMVDLGIGLVHDGDARAGATWLCRGTALSPNQPTIAEAAAAAGLRRGDFALARRHLSRSLADAPGNGPRLAALARAESNLVRGDSWRVWTRRAIAVDPFSEEVRRVAAALERQSGHIVEARRMARIAVALKPAASDSLAELSRAEHGLGLAPVAFSWLRRAIDLAPARVDLANLAVLLSVYFADTATVFSMVKRHAALARPPISRPARMRSADPDRRLRVGYVSADLYDHPAGNNLISLVEGHDRDRFEPVFYSGVLRADEMTERFRAAGAYRTVLGLDDRHLAESVAGDRIDILVNVAGRFAGNRPGLPAWHAAPVQLALYDLTSSGDEFTPTLLDEELHPEGSPEGFVEPVIRLPSLFLFPAPAPEAPPPPDGSRPIVFGSANNPAKWSSTTLSLWSRILARLPGARLWLNFHSRTTDPATRSALLHRLANHGIPVDRVDFGSGAARKADHLQALSRIDIALDPTPFCGANSTFEALWMGIPVVTLKGDRANGRVSAALLKQVGLADLVADSDDDYVAAALRLARDTDRRRRIRRDLRRALLQAPMMDRRAYVGAVERVYREAWAAACAAHHRLQTSR